MNFFKGLSQASTSASQLPVSSQKQSQKSYTLKEITPQLILVGFILSILSGVFAQSIAVFTRLSPCDKNFSDYSSTASIFSFCTALLLGIVYFQRVSVQNLICKFFQSGTSYSDIKSQGIVDTVLFALCFIFPLGLLILDCNVLLDVQTSVSCKITSPFLFGFSVLQSCIHIISIFYFIAVVVYVNPTLSENILVASMSKLLGPMSGALSAFALYIEEQIKKVKLPEFLTTKYWFNEDGSVRTPLLGKR